MLSQSTATTAIKTKVVVIINVLPTDIIRYIAIGLLNDERNIFRVCCKYLYKSIKKGEYKLDGEYLMFQKRQLQYNTDPCSFIRYINNHFKHNYHSLTFQRKKEIWFINEFLEALNVNSTDLPICGNDKYFKFVQQECITMRKRFIQNFKNKVQGCWYSNPEIMNIMVDNDKNYYSIFGELNIKKLVIYGEFAMYNLQEEFNYLTHNLIRPCKKLSALYIIDCYQDFDILSSMKEKMRVDGQQQKEQTPVIRSIKIENTQFVLFKLLINNGIIQFNKLRSLCIDVKHIHQEDILYPSEEIKKAIYDQLINVDEFVFTASDNVVLGLTKLDINWPKEQVYIPKKHDLITIIIDATHLRLRKIGINECVGRFGLYTSLRHRRYAHYLSRAKKLVTFQYSMGDGETLQQVKFTKYHFKFLTNVLKLMSSIKRKAFCFILCTNPYMVRSYRKLFFELFRDKLKYFHQNLKDMTINHYYILAQIRSTKYFKVSEGGGPLCDLLFENIMDNEYNDDDVDLIYDENIDNVQKGYHIYDEFGIKVSDRYKPTFKGMIGSQEITVIYDHQQIQNISKDNSTISSMRISNNFTWNELIFKKNESFGTKLISEKIQYDTDF